MGKLLKRFFEEITFFGGISFYLFVIGLFLILDKINYAYKIFLGLILIYIITIVIRTIYFKERPEKMYYGNFIEKLDASSFPSVHAARAVFLFLFVFFNFTYLIYGCLASALLLIGVLSSRIYLSKHDGKDIIGGIILGIVIFIILFGIF